MDLKRLGNYRIATLLGQGELGPTYKAFDVSVERFVVIKTVRRDHVFDWNATHEYQRFRAEANAIGMLNHPNIVALYDYGEENNLAYLVMEMIEGGRTLAMMFRRNEVIPLPLAVDYMFQLLSALAHAHGRGVVHGNVCPREIVVGNTNTVKLKGFWGDKIDGLRIPVDKAPEDQIAYLAPEQFLGNAMDARTDVYSIAAVFYQLLTGRAPFRGNLRTIRFDVLSNTPQSPSVSNRALKPLDDIIERAMAKRMDIRYATIEQFAAALKEALKQILPALPKAAEPRPPQPPPAPAAGKRVAGDRRTLAPGEMLFDEGEPGDDAFIIESGMIQVFKRGANGEVVPLAVIGRGEILGEMALVDNQPRMAAARAIEDSVLVVIPREDFQARLEKVDKVTHKLMGVLVNRVRNLAEEVKSLKLIVDKQ